MVNVPVVPVADLDKEMFTKKFRTTMPVLVKGLASSWGAMSRWDPAQLNGAVGDLAVQPFVSLDDVHFLENEKVARRESMSLSQLLRRVFGSTAVDPSPRPTQQIRHADGTTVATNSARIETTAVVQDLARSRQDGRAYLRGALFSALRVDIDVPAFMSGHADLDEELSGIWIGSQGCVTPLHFDPWHGILCQVRGRKRVTLFSPEDTENIYPRKQANSGLNQHISELVLERMAEPGYLEMYPLAEELTPWTVDLQAGDGLYIPPCWWHHVESLDACISVPLRWSIGNGITKAVRNVGFRGWRRNISQLRDDSDKSSEGALAVSCDPAEIDQKVEKLLRRDDLGNPTKSEVVDALKSHDGHAGRAAQALKKRLESPDAPDA